MKILVCITQVPDVASHAQNARFTSLELPLVISPGDCAAIEQALLLKEKHGAEVTLLSLGPPQAEVALWEGLAMGADKAFLLPSHIFNTQAKSARLAQARVVQQKLGHMDIVLCGQTSKNGGITPTGPQLASYLNMPYITDVCGTHKLRNKIIEVERTVESGPEIVEVNLPAVLATPEEAASLRFATLKDILSAFDEKEVTVWSESDFSLYPTI